MRRVLIVLFSVTLLLSSCSYGRETQSPDGIALSVKENEKLLLQCVAEMEKLGSERIYVAMEKPKSEKGEEIVTAEVRLVSYEKESDDRTEIQSESLEKALTLLGLKLIFFQTASDARRCVIFSFQKESEKSAQGFYYSYDALPCGWWGRAADLERRDGRYFQANQKGDAWYYTLPVTDCFFYFEKTGSLLA